MHKQLSSGFTLIEILVVIGIVGALAGVIGWYSWQSVQKARLNEVATLVMVELKRARSAAQLKSDDQNITWAADSLTIGGRFVPLPYGVTIKTKPTTFFTYVAPYAEFQPNNPYDNEGRLELVDGSGRWHTAVDMQGVTGRPVRRAVVAMADPLP